MSSHFQKKVTFLHSYLHSDGALNRQCFSIIIPQRNNGDVEELVNLYMQQMDPMIRCCEEYLKLKSALDFCVSIESQLFRDETAEQLLQQNDSDILFEEIAKSTASKYKEELIQFEDSSGYTEEHIFAQKFHRMVHSSFLEDILKKEQTYARVIADLVHKMDTELEKLHLMQENEMETQMRQLDVTVSSEDINNLIGQQFSAQGLVFKKHQSEIGSMKFNQKKEYREWILSHAGQSYQISSWTTPLGNRSSMYMTLTPALEESFTIHLGSQLKHMHNIRILSAKFTDLCSPLHLEESLIGLNMALGLYSSSLCGIVALIPSFQIQANQNINKNASMSTEFHFEEIEEQMSRIENGIRDVCLKANNAGSSTDINLKSVMRISKSIKISDASTSAKLKTGDFFITKHSNLSQSHVIFHLISDEFINSTSEINSRHPVILGLRNILKTASHHDVTTLTIPALLRHEMSEEMTVQWCMRRAELVFKCAKGFMIESATWGGAQLSTLQLLLPHDISEELFTTLVGMVPQVFREANPKILVEGME